MGENWPAKVPHPIIQGIQDREDGEGFILLKPKAEEERFHKGDKVRVVTGPLEGKLLIYEGMTSHNRVCALLTMLGREAHVIVSEKSLTAA